MTGRRLGTALSLAALVALFACGAVAQQASPGATPVPQSVRKIPAITAPDEYPRACVDCHVNLPEKKMDARLSTLMAQWNKAVAPELLAKAQASAPQGTTLKGRHPKVGTALGSIPARCMKCHTATSKTAPPFSRLIHRIHLVGGDKNEYLTQFQGDCTHCHKLNLETGAWTMPSGTEK